jgi:hypothetical protein
MRALEGGGWQADLSFAKSDGEALGDRRLQTPAAGCATLRDPVSLVIALMVEAREAEATLQVPAPEPSTERTATMAASFSVSSGLLPNLGFGATMDLGLNPAGRLPLRFDSTYWFPDSTVQAGRGGGEFWAWVGGVGVCPTVISREVVEGTVCAGVQAGVVHGTGIGLHPTGSPTRPYGDIDARARLSFPLLRPLLGFVELGVAVPWMRPRFVYSDQSDNSSVEVHRPSAVVFFGGIGVKLRASGGSGASATSP